MSVHADNLGLPKDGSKCIIGTWQSKERAEEWVIQSRSMSENLINYRLVTRSLSALGISIPIYVVVAWRRAARQAK